MFARSAVLCAAACVGTWSVAYANNPGDPLFCQPQEGTTFLMINGGAGVFTADPDCFGSFIPSVPAAASNELSISTSQGGTLTGTVAPSGINYVYTPPTPNFTGRDTFSYNVTTAWNSAGGTGSNCVGCTNRPGGALAMTITLNVVPATTSLAVNVGATASVPVPPGSVTGCGNFGSPGSGPPPTAVVGCTTAVSNRSPFGQSASIAPSHGTLTRTGPTGLTYTPNPGYRGPDTFTYFVLGANSDGTRALSTSEVTASVTVSAVPAVPTLGTWGMIILAVALVLVGAIRIRVAMLA